MSPEELKLATDALYFAFALGVLWIISRSRR
jgi:hypothetical protein